MSRVSGDLLRSKAECPSCGSEILRAFWSSRSVGQTAFPVVSVSDAKTVTTATTPGNQVAIVEFLNGKAHLGQIVRGKLLRLLYS